MEKRLRILLLEHSLHEAELVIRTLTDADLDHDLHWAEAKAHYLGELDSFKPDMVIAEYAMPGFRGLEAFHIARNYSPEMPVVIATREPVAAECLKAGVDDFVPKDQLVRLPAVVRNIFARRRAFEEKKAAEVMNAELRDAYARIEESNQRIKDSLNYAKMIQESMLPDTGVLGRYFSGSFVIFKPKDIVSGDFYWLFEQDNKLLVAVADCTGHGVPGALMSMIGIGILNQAVTFHNETSPGAILRRLNDEIKKALKQESDRGRADGMDIALISVDRDRRELRFAGANRHLAFFSAGRPPIALIKGDKRAIGGLHNSDTQHFTEHLMSYSPGDVLYMFTDGYADQFGGARGKRMMTRNLINILERSLYFGIEEQEIVLLHWLRKWQRNLEQTDDILLFGARF